MAGGSKYNLKWDSHHAETFGNLDALRSREMLVDITLSCNEQLLKAHKLLLCAGSGYFERVLRHDSGHNPVFYFFGVDAHLLKLLIGFIYVGEVEVPAVDLEKFIQLADALEVKGLKDDHSKRVRSSVYDATETSAPDEQEAIGRRSRSCSKNIQYSTSIRKAHRRNICQPADRLSGISPVR